MLKENCPTPDQLDSLETFKVKGRRKKTGPFKFLFSSELKGTVARKEPCNLESSSLVLIEDNFSFVLITSYSMFASMEEAKKNETLFNS